MFPWKTVGMRVPSYSSPAFSVQRMGDCLKTRTYTTGPDDITYSLVFFNTFEELKLPIKGPMEDAGVIKLYEPSPTPCLYRDSNWLLQKTWWAGSPLSRFFWLITQLRLSLACSASARFQASRLDALIQQLQTEGGAAMSMRSTRGSGSLGAEGPAWED
jgi:hypothetical protein